MSFTPGLPAVAGASGPVRPVPEAAGARVLGEGSLPGPEAGVRSFQWSDLKSGDLAGYVAHLRAFGLPEYLVRQIIVGEVNRLYFPREAAIRPKRRPRDPNLWQGLRSMTVQVPGREARERLRALKHERIGLIRTLLGGDVFAWLAQEDWLPDQLEQSLPGVPGHLREAVQDLRSRFEELRQEFAMSTGGYVDGDMQRAIAAAEEEFRNGLAAMLTPEQLRAYDLRHSDLAAQVRQQLTGFTPTQEEFVAVFEFQETLKAIEAPGALSDASISQTPGQPGGREARIAEARAALEAALGPDRAKELRLREDGSYRSLFEAGVTKESVLQVAGMREQVESAVNKLAADPAIPEASREAALREIRSEATARLAGLLGERLARSYVNQGGSWLPASGPKIVPASQ